MALLYPVADGSLHAFMLQFTPAEPVRAAAPAGLHAACRGKQMALEDVLFVAHKVSLALAFLHDKKVAHRCAPRPRPRAAPTYTQPAEM